MAASAAVNRKGTAKLNELLDIQEAIQKRWQDEKIFEIDAAKPGSDEDKFVIYVLLFIIIYNINVLQIVMDNFVFYK